MTTHLGLDTHGASVEVDIQSLLETNGAVVGNPGAGKSRTIRKILELAMGQAQRIVLDVEDEFHTLREEAPGMLVAGPSGDCPATPQNAEQLARFLLETGLDAVLQLNDLGLGGQANFVSLFLDAMINSPTSLWHPTLVVLDEAQRMAPLNEVSDTCNAVIDFMTRGRKRSFGMLVATPRLSRLNANVRGTVNNWLLGRAGMTLDKKSSADMMGVSTSGPEAKALSSLGAGDFWVFGPALSVIEPTRVHVGNVKTTHLRPGQRNVPTPPASEKLQTMLAKLHVKPEVQVDPKSAGGAGQPQTSRTAADVQAMQAELQAAEKRGYERGYAKGNQKAFFDTLDMVEESLREEIESLRVTGRLVQRDNPKARTSPEPRPADPGSPLPATPDAAPARKSAPTGELHAAARKLLVGAVNHAPAKFSWGHLATVVGLKPSGGHFNSGRKDLRDRGFVEEGGNLVWASAAGVEEMGDMIPAPSTPQERLEMWCERLDKPAPEMLKAIVAAGGWIPADGLAAALGIQPRGGHWNSGIAMLRNNGLIEASGKDYRASPLFERA